MKNLLKPFIIIFATVSLFSCATDKDFASADAAFSSSSKGSSGSGTQAGTLTAGEWNDLENWDFWQDSIVPTYGTYFADWKFFPIHRVDIELLGSSSLSDIPIILKYDGNLVWQTRTNNQGKAVLWADLFIDGTQIDESKLELPCTLLFSTTSRDDTASS